MTRLFVKDFEKMWCIEAQGTSFKTSYGKVSASTLDKLKSTTKEFDSEEKCKKEEEKIIKSKCKDGYEELTVNVPGVDFELLMRVDQVKKGHTPHLNTGYAKEIDAALLQEIVALPDLEELTTSCPALIQQAVNIAGLYMLIVSGDEAVGATLDIAPKLKGLEYLELKNATGFTTLPESIGQIASIKELHLSKFQGLNSIPQSIGQLVTLQTLIIISCKPGSPNKLEIPESIGQLMLLKNLIIEDCRVKEIPESIGNLVVLEELNLSRNYYGKELPDAIGNLESLTTLNLYQNDLKELPGTIGNLKNLTTLNIGSNQLTEISNAVCQLRNLGTLDVTNNPLESIKADFLKLENLTDFAVKEMFDDTTITNIPEDVLDEGLDAIREFLRNNA